MGFTVPNTLLTCATLTILVCSLKSLLKGGHVEQAVVAHRDDTQADTLAGSSQLPWHDIGVMLHDRDDDLIVSPHERLAIGGGHEVESLGGATCEHDLRRAARIDEAPHRLTRCLMQLGGLHAEVVHATMYIGILVEILMPHRIEHTQRLLRRGGIIEIHQGLAMYLTGEYREVGPYLLYIVHLSLINRTTIVFIPHLRQGRRTRVIVIALLKDPRDWARTSCIRHRCQGSPRKRFSTS